MLLIPECHAKVVSRKEAKVAKEHKNLYAFTTFASSLKYFN